MTVSDLIAKLQLEDPGAEVVTRGIDYLDEVIRVSELTPVKLRAFSAESVVWFEYWKADGARPVPGPGPVDGLLLE